MSHDVEMGRAALAARSPKLSQAHQHGQRVEVQYKNGETVRGRVGRSTGWAPTYIILKTVRSMGGYSICENEVDTIRLVKVRRR